MKAVRTISKSDQLMVAQITSRLAAALKPEQIYFFGSRATGDYNDWSDYDFMVIVPNCRRRRSFTRSRINNLLEDLDLEHDHDIKVWTRKEFTQQLHLKASIPSAVLHYGKLVFGKPLIYETARQYSRNRNATVSEGQPPRYDPLRVKLTAEWFVMAQLDLQIAANCIGNSKMFYGPALYHCQQAAEKAMKAYGLWNDRRLRKIHDLQSLALMCNRVDPTLAISVKSIKWLSDWNILGRYRLEPLPSEAEVSNGFALSRDLYDALLERMPKEVREAVAKYHA